MKGSKYDISGTSLEQEVSGLRPDPDKLEVIHEIPASHTRKQVRKFLGFTNFYRRFMLSNFSSVIDPLTALTSEKNKFE